VVSRQTPARQLWLSSPISGPWHYDFCVNELDWKCTKQSIRFWDRMQQELSNTLDQQVVFSSVKQ